MQHYKSGITRLQVIVWLILNIPQILFQYNSLPHRHQKISNILYYDYTLTVGFFLQGFRIFHGSICHK